MLKSNIIQRRDLEPLWLRANELVRHYEKAAGCITAVMGADCVEVELSKHPKALFFCSLCKRYNQSAAKMAPYEYPCSPMHLDAADKARRLGGSYIYSCPLGFLYWTSPFFAGERFAGAFISSVMPASEKQKIIDRIFALCKREISKPAISQYLSDVPQKSGGEIEALARLLLLCAEHISSSGPCRDDFNGKGTGLFFADYRGACSLPSVCLPNLLEKERLLFACLRRGDSTEAQKMVRELLKDLIGSGGRGLEQIKLKAIELVVLLSRTGGDSGNNGELVEASSRFIKRIENSVTPAELVENVCLIVDRMALSIFSFRGIRHSSALRKAERFIWDNYNRKISLKEIAAVSGLSAPYFSTVFKDEMGENLSNYLNRLRVDKASALLRETDYPINGIASSCGFEDQSWFSKIFKCYAGVSPYKYRKHGGGNSNG